ncbi:disease resistance protein RUN1-like [Prosopis cineraria]|uniref:disease resistance protein RUN1-like n=1 Tax=Prosopis cineraria TaxID=364024 RepID=UPI002410A1B3|nr:disease resistance protein RUN1-like [Prosopis cineraria]
MEYFESSSSSSSLKPNHVYISFRGEDTRRFIHSLSAALKAQGFRIFGDDKRLEMADSNLPSHLLRAMRESWIWIFVLSKNYASSSWCLKELSQVVGPLILCRKEYLGKQKYDRSKPPGHTFYVNRSEERFEENLDRVMKRWRQHMKQLGNLWGRWNNTGRDRIIPVFYDVDSKSFTQHIQESFSGNLSEEALQKVTNLSGWDVPNEKWAVHCGTWHRDAPCFNGHPCIMMLPKLRKMNLSGSKSLIKSPDFGEVQNLERLDLEGCTGLLELDPSIAKLSKLKSLNLRNCVNLISIPNHLFALNSLEILNLAGCSKLAHCLNFSPLKSSIEVKLLGIWSNPFLENFLYFLLFVLAEQKTYRRLVRCCLIYLCAFVRSIMHKA